MFQVELYKESRLVEARKERTERAATVAVDAMITAVHRGDHGSGEFRVSADRINDIGLFQEALFDSEPFAYPLTTRAA